MERKMLWTAEAIEVLKNLALAGRSASVIAATLGAASRNAVIGKADRIGIRLNGDGRAATFDGLQAGKHGRRPARGEQSLASSLCAHRAGRRLGLLPRPRFRRCAGWGSRTSTNPPADGRSAIR